MHFWIDKRSSGLHHYGGGGGGMRGGGRPGPGGFYSRNFGRVSRHPPPLQRSSSSSSNNGPSVSTLNNNNTNNHYHQEDLPHPPQMPIFSSSSGDPVVAMAAAAGHHHRHHHHHHGFHHPFRFLNNGESQPGVVPLYVQSDNSPTTTGHFRCPPAIPLIRGYNNPHPIPAGIRRQQRHHSATVIANPGASNNNNNPNRRRSSSSSTSSSALIMANPLMSSSTQGPPMQQRRASLRIPSTESSSSPQHHLNHWQNQRHPLVPYSDEVMRPRLIDNPAEHIHFNFSNHDHHAHTFHPSIVIPPTIDLINSAQVINPSTNNTNAPNTTTSSSTPNCAMELDPSWARTKRLGLTLCFMAFILLCTVGAKLVIEGPWLVDKQSRGDRSDASFYFFITELFFVLFAMALFFAGVSCLRKKTNAYLLRQFHHYIVQGTPHGGGAMGGGRRRSTDEDYFSTSADGTSTNVTVGGSSNGDPEIGIGETNINVNYGGQAPPRLYIHNNNNNNNIQNHLMNMHISVQESSSFGLANKPPPYHIALYLPVPSSSGTLDDEIKDEEEGKGSQSQEQQSSSLGLSSALVEEEVKVEEEEDSEDDHREEPTTSALEVPSTTRRPETPPPPYSQI